jgi:hypothetical protein
MRCFTCPCPEEQQSLPATPAVLLDVPELPALEQLALDAVLGFVAAASQHLTSRSDDGDVGDDDDGQL